jgi:hypothetical protein
MPDITHGDEIAAGALSDVLGGLNTDKALELWSQYVQHCSETRHHAIDKKSFLDTILKGVIITHAGKDWTLVPDQVIPRPWTDQRQQDADVLLADSGRPIAEQEANKTRRRQLLEDLAILVKAKKITIRDLDGVTSLGTDTTGDLV